MKKTYILVSLIILSLGMTSCSLQVDFNAEDIRFQDTLEIINADALTSDNIDTLEIVFAYWDNTYTIDSKEYLVSSYYMFDIKLAIYLDFLFGVMWSKENDILNYFEDVDKIDFVTVNLEEERIYIGPKNLTDKTLKDVYVIEFDAELIINRDLSHIDSLEELSSLIEKFQSVNVAPILKSILHNEVNYENSSIGSLDYYAYLMGALDTINEISYVEGTYIILDVTYDGLNFRFLNLSEAINIEFEVIPSNIEVNDTVRILTK